jgi:spore germination protein KC
MLLLSSCTDVVELDHLAIFSGVGFDQGTDMKLVATVQLILHRQLKVQSQGGNSGYVTTNVIVNGENLLDISRNFSLQSGRKSVWSHAKVFIIGEELAKSGIGEIIDILERDNDIRRKTYLCIAKGNAGEVLSAETTRLETIQAYNISDMIELYTRHGKAVLVDINRYAITTSPNNDNAFITGISLIPKTAITPNATNELQLEGTAILKKDQLVGWFDETETKGLLWILGETKSCIENIEYPKKGAPISIEILSAGSKIIPIFEHQTIKKIKVEVKCTGRIAQANPNVQLMKIGELDKIVEKVEEQIEKEITLSIEKGQEYHADIFGFNEVVNNKDPKLFKSLKNNWDEIFAALEVEVDIDLTLRSAGLLIDREEEK